MSWFDSHCHPEVENLETELSFAQECNVMGLIAVGTTPEKSEGVLDYVRALRSRDTDVSAFASVGVHPHDAFSSGQSGVEFLESLLMKDEQGLIVGVGECGLDYYYEHSPRDAQLEVFRAQIELARRFNKTLVIHTRDAWEDTFEVLDSVQLPERTIFHCFVGTEKEARAANDYGIYMSFSGIVTFKNSDALRQAALIAKRELILIETDAPYLSPVPLRGKPNQFANVSITGEYLSDHLEIAKEDFQKLVWENTTRAFAL